MKKKLDIQYFQKNILLNFGAELEKYGSDSDLPYMLLGSFALLVNDLIKKQENNALLKKAILLIEEMAASESTDVKDLFIVGFLEVFSDEISSVEYSKKNCSKIVNNSLNVILEYWRNKKS